MKNTKIIAPETPELDKESACRDEARTIGNFLEWLQDTWVQDVAEHNGYHASDVPIFDIKVQDVLHKYFEIDGDICERERRELLHYQRLMNRDREDRKELGIEKRRYDPA